MAKQCKECDEYNPHPWIPGQRKAECSGCGYKSHWIEGTYFKEHGAVIVNGGYQADWRDGEYPVTDVLDKLDGKPVRVTLCCFTLTTADVVRR